MGGGVFQVKLRQLIELREGVGWGGIPGEIKAADRTERRGGVEGYSR